MHSSHRTLLATTLLFALGATACGEATPDVDPVASVSPDPVPSDVTPTEVDVRPEPGLYGPEVVAAIPTPDGPAQIVASAGGLFVLTSSRNLVRIDPATAQPTIVSDDIDGGGLVVGAGAMWTAQGRGGIARLDPVTGAPTGDVLEGVGARRRIVTTSSELIALGFNVDYRPSTGDFDFENGPFHRIDPASGAVTDIRVDLDTVDLLATEDAVYGIRASDGLFRVALDTGEVTHSVSTTADVPTTFSNISSVVGNEVWLATKQRIDRFALDDLSALGTVDIEGLLVVHAVAGEGDGIVVIGETRLDPSNAATTIAAWRLGSDGEVSAPVDLGRFASFDFYNAVVTDGSVWVTKFQDDVVLQVPLDAFV